MCVSVDICRGQRITTCSHLYLFPSLRQSLLFFAGPPASGALQSLPHLTTGTLGLQMHATVFSFYMVSGDPNSGTHIFCVKCHWGTASALNYSFFLTQSKYLKKCKLRPILSLENPPTDSHYPGINPQNPCSAFAAVPCSLNPHVSRYHSTLERVAQPLVSPNSPWTFWCRGHIWIPSRVFGTWKGLRCIEWSRWCVW